MSALRALSLRQVSRALVTRAGPASMARFAPAVTRAFSASPRAFGQGTTDVALATKLQEELSYEIEGVTPKEVPEFIQEFNKEGVWKIENKQFSDEVSFSRKFGNEDIRLTFSVMDLRNEPEEDFEEDENASEQEPRDETTMVSFPIRIALTISKGPSHGALALDMICQDGTFAVENVAYYADAKLATDLTAEANFQRSGQYLGPQFDALDIGLQEEFERFLQERGLDEKLAAFIPDFAEFKEQEEYTHWLKGVKAFIDA